MKIRRLVCLTLGHDWHPDSGVTLTFADLIRTGYVCLRCDKEIEPLTW